MAIIKKTKGGSVHSKTTLKDNHSGDVLGTEEQDKQLRLPFEVPEGMAIGVAKWTSKFSSSHSFQTFGVEIGVDFPFAMKPGDVKAFIKAFEEAEKICDEALAEKIRDAPAILSRLAGLKDKVKKRT